MKTDKSKYGAGGKLKKGVFREYFKDGTLSCIGEYRNGEKIGEWKYYLLNGLLKAVGKYSSGKMTGEWKWYRENGELMQTGSFDDEKKVGIWKRYPPKTALTGRPSRTCFESCDQVSAEVWVASDGVRPASARVAALPDGRIFSSDPPMWLN